jgi:hypothetical protein
LKRIYKGEIPSEPKWLDNMERKRVTVPLVAEWMARSGITAEEASTFDDYVIPWCEDYLSDERVPLSDDIRTAVGERDTPPTSDYAILGCFPPRLRSASFYATPKAATENWVDALPKKKKKKAKPADDDDSDAPPFSGPIKIADYAEQLDPDFFSDDSY